MADNERSLAPVYIGIGVLATVGAGYLAWRFLLRDEETRSRAAGAIRRAGQEAEAWGRHAASAVKEAVQSRRA